MNENWHQSRDMEFYGNGDASFLFKLIRIESLEPFGIATKLEATDIQVFDPTYINNKFMYGDHRSLMIGSSKEGNSALFITNNFKMGYSDTNETFENPILT